MIFCKIVIVPDLRQLLLTAERDRDGDAVLQQAFLFREAGHMVEIDEDATAYEKEIFLLCKRLHKGGKRG